MVWPGAAASDPSLGSDTYPCQPIAGVQERLRRPRTPTKYAKSERVSEIRIRLGFEPARCFAQIGVGAEAGFGAFAKRNQNLFGIAAVRGIAGGEQTRYGSGVDKRMPGYF